MHDKKSPMATLHPTAEQSFQIEGRGLCNFVAVERRTGDWQREGRVAEACEERYRAVQALIDLLPDDETLVFDWNHANSRAALEVVRLSAIDHLLIGDFELSTALLELLLDLDPEDHLEATELLAYNYIELGECELMEELLPDISEGPSRLLLQLWASFEQGRGLPQELIDQLKRRHAAYFEEFCADEHPADESYLRDIESERPSLGAQARELWLKTEILWPRHPQFIAALRGAK